METSSSMSADSQFAPHPLGHSKMSTTLEIYTLLIPEQQRMHSNRISVDLREWKSTKAIWPLV